MGIFGPGVTRVPGLLRSERSDTMTWVVGTGAFLGMLAIASGIVTLRTGWILPMARRHVTRPRLHRAVCGWPLALRLGVMCLVRRLRK
ncbi:hypothetical protein CG723_08200 [Streptomyces sp. CB01635]|nr:hypothetical protein CG723_08200 [Streptomyces sp. CB01635]